MHISETAWWNDLMHGVYGPRQGGSRIIIDSESASTGVGKTTLACATAQMCANAFGYELQPDDFTLSGEAYLERWREHPDAHQPSVIVLDELAGAGAGDARRSMSNKNVNLGRSWQLMRKKRIVTITTLPHWSDADVRMRRFADFRLWCLKRPIGYFRPYKVTSTFDRGDVRTESYDDIPRNRIPFPNLDRHDDEYFEAVTEKKDNLLDSEHFDADELQEEELDPEEVEREQKKADAQRARDLGLSTREVSEVVDMSQSWVSKYTDKPQTTPTEAPADD
jgi:hypothetical protein